MNKLLFLILLFLSPLTANSRGAQGIGELHITKKAGTEEFYLHYNYRGVDKQVRLIYPFDDSAIVTDGILIKENDTVVEEASVTFGDILVFTACDVNFSNKKVMFFINRKKNCEIIVKPGSGGYLQTGLSVFLINDSKAIIKSDMLTFIDSETENARLSYYHVGSDGVKLLKNKMVKVTVQQAADIDSFKEPKLLGQIFDDAHTNALEQIDSKAAAYKVIVDDLHCYDNPTYFDSIASYNDRLSAYLSKVCATVSATIDAPFTKTAGNNVDIYTSADKMLRCYTWNSRENANGLAQMVRNVVQFKTGKGTKSATDNDGLDWVPDGLVEGIKTIHTKDNKTVYLVSSNFVDLPEDQHFWLTAVVIENGHLKQYPIFKSGGKTRGQITYDHAAVTHDEDEDVPDKKEPTLHFSKDLQSIYVPFTDKKNKLTGQYYVYKFDESFFVR